MKAFLPFALVLLLLTNGCRPAETAYSSPWLNFDEATDKSWSQTPVLVFGYPTFSASSLHGKELLEESMFILFERERRISLVLLEFDGWSDSRFEQFACITGPTKDPFCVLYLGTSRLVFEPLSEDSIAMAIDLFMKYEALNDK